MYLEKAPSPALWLARAKVEKRIKILILSFYSLASETGSGLPDIFTWWSTTILVSVSLWLLIFHLFGNFSLTVVAVLADDGHLQLGGVSSNWPESFGNKPSHLYWLPCYLEWTTYIHLVIVNLWGGPGFVFKWWLYGHIISWNPGCFQSHLTCSLSGWTKVHTWF